MSGCSAPAGPSPARAVSSGPYAALDAHWRVRPDVVLRVRVNWARFDAPGPDDADVLNIHAEPKVQLGAGPWKAFGEAGLGIDGLDWDAVEGGYHPGGGGMIAPRARWSVEVAYRYFDSSIGSPSPEFSTVKLGSVLTLP